MVNDSGTVSFFAILPRDFAKLSPFYLGFWEQRCYWMLLESPTPQASLSCRAQARSCLKKERREESEKLTAHYIKCISDNIR